VASEPPGARHDLTAVLPREFRFELDAPRTVLFSRGVREWVAAPGRDEEVEDSGSRFLEDGGNRFGRRIEEQADGMVSKRNLELDFDLAASGFDVDAEAERS